MQLQSRGLFKIQWKVTLLVALAIVGTVSAVVWKTRTLLVRDRLNFMADASMKEVAPLKRLVQDRMEDHKAKLVKFAATRATQGAGRVKNFSDYDVVALVQPSQDAQWAPAWIEKSPSIKTDLWPAGYDLTLLKSLPYAKVRDGEVMWSRLSDRQGSPVYAVLISVEIQNNSAAQANVAADGGALPDSTDYTAAQAGLGRRAFVVGFATQDPVADLTEDYIGSINNVFLVDDKGYVAAHVNKAYLGALFTEDPIVKEIVSTKKTAASGNYEDLESRAVLGHFERIDRTNLYAVITTPLQGVKDLSSAYVNAAVTMAGAVGLLCLLLAFLVGRSISSPIGSAIESLRAIRRGEARSWPEVSSGDEVAELMRMLADGGVGAGGMAGGAAGRIANDTWQIQKSVSGAEKNSAAPEPTPAERAIIAAQTEARLAEERRAAYEAFNEGFTKTIKEPLLAILGHAQLAKAKAAEAEVRSHAESIEREARRASGVIDRLQSFGGEVVPIPEGETMNLEKVVEDVLAKQDEDLKIEGIEVIRDLHAVPTTRGSSEQMRIVIGNLLENSREALLARPVKRIKIHLDFMSDVMNDAIFLSVHDTGVGMTRDVKERAFEPFSKGFTSPKRLGLGLSLVQTVTKNLGGTCQIESTPGDGATVTLKIPVTVAEREEFRSAEGARLAQVVAERFKSQPPAGASFADAPTPPPSTPMPPPAVAFEPHDGSDDDDDDEVFASVNLSAGKTPAEPPQLEAGGGFRVKIRRPKLRS